MLLQENISLKPHNTFGIDAKARYFVSFDSLEALQEVTQTHPFMHSKQLILGGGSNILLTSDFDGIVLHNKIGGIEMVGENEDFVLVRAGAGVQWHQFVLFCIAHNLAGAENLSLIPGSVGASPMQNIGAYGVEIKDIFYQLEAWHLKDRVLQIFNREDCQFGYRESVFKHQYKNQFVITSVTYQLRKSPQFNTSYGAIQQELESMGAAELSIGLISQAVINIRSSKLPDWQVVGNAGSFFKNPQILHAQYLQLKEQFPNIVAFPAGPTHTKLAAGWLIEQCGWKGYRKGDAGCYPKQALVLVNYGTATGSEIYDLSEAILQSVQERFGVVLEREVNIIPSK